MRDDERLIKNNLCDRLMKEGIDGRTDEEAFVRVCALTDLTGELGRQDSRTPCPSAKEYSCRTGRFARLQQSKRNCWSKDMERSGSGNSLR
jgi:hypothetical protein